MKHKNLVIILVVLIILIVTVSVSIANIYNDNQPNKIINKTNTTKNYCNFIDSNNDGLCDNCGFNDLVCNGSKQQIKNHTNGHQVNQHGQKNTQSSNSGANNQQVGNKYGQQSSSSSSSNSYGHHYSQQSSSSGNGYGQQSSSQSGSGNSYGQHHGQGVHSQQRIHQ